MENWTQIPGHSKYSVSNYGRIRNNRTNKVRKIFRNRYGGGFSVLWSDEKNKNITVNMSSILACLMPPRPGPEYGIYHIDGNKQNNDLKNLKWLTNAERIQHGYATKRRHPTGFGRPLSIEERRAMTLMWKAGRSQCYIGKKLGRDNSTVSRYLSGKLG